MLASLFVALTLSLGFASAQIAVYGQCGGLGYAGGTVCASGSICTVVNPYYSQCLPGTGTPTTSPSSSQSISTPVAPSPTSTGTTAPGAGGYRQVTSGTSSFTMYSGCADPACGVAANGYTAAILQLAFGSVPGIGPGDACGRCFALTANADPYSPSYTGPFGKSIVVKVTDMCPAAGNEQWCGQTQSNPVNSFGMQYHFDLCEDTGASGVFFPSGHGALLGSFQEVSCSQWSGSDGSPQWTGACIAGESAPLWPSVGCGNQGTAP